MKLKFIFASGFLALAGFGVSQDQGLVNLIRKMANASRNLTYSATRTVEYRFGQDRSKHIEIVLKKGMRTRIEFPDDGSYRGQIVVENERERKRYFPDRNLIEVTPPKREELSSRLLKLLQKANNGIKIVRSDGPAIAGIDTQQIQIGDSNGKIFQKLWIDPSTYLVLKREVYDRHGQLSGTTEITKVDYRPRFDRGDFVLEVRGAKRVTPYDHLTELVAKEGFQRVGLPPKDPFQLESSGVRQIDGVPTLVQVYVNADGRIFLYQVRSSVDSQKLKQLAWRDANVYSWEFGGSSFVLMGDFPKETLRAIAERVKS